MRSDLLPPEVRDGAGDAALAVADPALPALRTLLDPGTLTRRLRRSWPGAHDARVTYLRYKPGTALVAAVEIRDDDGVHLGLAHAVADAGVPKLAKLARSARRAATWCVADEELRLVVAGAAADRHLPGLAGELRAPGARTLRYKPARRWVGRTSAGARPMLVKAYRPAAAVHGAAAVRLLSEAGVPTPALVVGDHGRGVLAWEWLAGDTLDRVPPSRGALAGAGELLARLHALRPAGRPALSGGAHAGSGDGTTLAALAPASEELAWAERAEAALRPRLRLRGTGDRVVRHGDFSADQVLRRPDGSFALLDLDRLTAGPRVGDLGSWIADRLIHDGTQHDVASGTADPDDRVTAALDRAAPLLVGYTEAAGHRIDERELLLAAAAATLDRATEPFRWRRPGWVRDAVLVVRCAEQLARRAGVTT